MTFLAIIIGTILGNWLWKILKERRTYKYEWTCPICGTFTASASDQWIVDRAKEIHTHEET